jgi:hypothetical protein
MKQLMLGALMCCLLSLQVDAQKKFAISAQLESKTGSEEIFPALSGSVWYIRPNPEPEKIVATLYDGSNAKTFTLDLSLDRKDHTSLTMYSTPEGALWLISSLTNKKEKKVRFYAGKINEDGTLSDKREIWSTPLQDKITFTNMFKLYESPDKKTILMSTKEETAIFNANWDLQYSVEHKFDRLTELIEPAVANNGDFAYTASTYESAVSMSGAKSYDVVHFSSSRNKIITTPLARFKISNMSGSSESCIAADKDNNFVAIMAGHKNGLNAKVNEFSIVKISSADQSVTSNLYTVDEKKTSIDCLSFGSSIHSPMTLSNGNVFFSYGFPGIWLIQIDPKLNVSLELTAAVIEPKMPVYNCDGIQTNDIVEIYSNGTQEMVSAIIANNSKEFNLSDTRNGSIVYTKIAPGEPKTVELLDVAPLEGVQLSSKYPNGVRTSKGVFFLGKKKTKPYIIMVQ